MQKLLLAIITVQILSLQKVLAQDHAKVSYGPEDRQYLDIYIAPSETPTPVYFDAHGNGGNTNMPSSIVGALQAIGVSIVAWESLTAVGTPNEVETGWADADLMFEWVKENASTYNFDTTKLIIGGSSRGSILSWKYGHRPNPNVKGLYMYNALPDRIWSNADWWLPTEEVNAASPPIFFVYKREPGSSDDLVDPDGHDPENALTIMSKYDELGIERRDTLVHSIGATSNTDKYQFLVDFILRVLDAETVLNQDQKIVQSIAAFPNPFRDQITISGLSEEQHCVLRSLNGKMVSEGRVESINWQKLQVGVYLLSITGKSGQEIIKLKKE